MDRGSTERKGPPPPLILTPSRLSPVSPELSPLSGILRQKKSSSSGAPAQTQCVTFAGSPTMSRSSTSSLPREPSGMIGNITKGGGLQGVPTVEVSPPFAMQLSPKSRKSVSPSLLRRALSPSLRRRNKIRNSKRSHSTGNVDMCNSCGFPILEESMVSAQGSRYHTSCFRCTSHSEVDSLEMACRARWKNLAKLATTFDRSNYIARVDCARTSRRGNGKLTQSKNVSRLKESSRSVVIYLVFTL
ncbi:hypothetical protein RRG08_022089 [Elysia crispata]|uniref:LIM zinc-binding domain-containing protein n=1 Tax=Elysia crispata TaxID=231223 RepID=A0AAE0Y251_9GAST|nr:hypothetical protein RRG08_022089 [Elysia crispata]